MVLKDRPLTRRRGRRIVFGRDGRAAPLSHGFARPLLRPSAVSLRSAVPHWTARLDAEAIAEIREEERLLELTGGYCPEYRIIW